MKKIKKDKEVLIKRIYFDTNKYDYIYVEKEQGETTINKTANRTEGFKAVNAEWYIRFLYKSKNIIKSKLTKEFAIVAIGVILAYFLNYFFNNKC